MVGRTVEVIVEGQSKLVSRQNGNVELGWERRGRFSDMPRRSWWDELAVTSRVFPRPGITQGEILEVESPTRRTSRFSAACKPLPLALEETRQRVDQCRIPVDGDFIDAEIHLVIHPIGRVWPSTTDQVTRHGSSMPSAIERRSCGCSGGLCPSPVTNDRP